MSKLRSCENRMRIYLSFFLAFFACDCYGQVRGSILDPASPALNPLDPNGDGYITSSGAAFTGPLDQTEFELPFLPFQQFEQEPAADNQYAPGCEFYELITDTNANVYPGYYYFQDPDGIADNGDELIFFRFRVSRFSNGATAFSILVDTDYRLGFTGAEADANAVRGNPGFEKEVTLLNHTGSDGGVWVWDVDGKANPSMQGFHGPLSKHYQVSYALNQDPNCTSRVPVFVDMYVPFSAFGIPLTTQLRMAVAVNEDIGSSLGGSASDIAGVNGIAMPDDDDQFIAVITRQPPLRIDQPGNIAPLTEDATISLDENSPPGVLLHTVTAQDANGGAVVFSITEGNVNNAFSIDPVTGALTVNNDAALDREVTSSFVLLVQASDGSLYDNAVVTVNLNDLNDNPPSVSDVAVDLPENSPTGAVVYTIAGNDPDASSMLSYSFIGENPSHPFVLNNVTGEIKIVDASAIDFESNASFSLMVQVSDGKMTDDAQIIVNITDVNEPPTVISASLIIEDFLEGDIIYTIVAGDPDTGDVLTYAMRTGDFDGAFAIGAQTGEITIVDEAALFSLPTDLQLVVTATDLGGLSTEGVIHLTIVRPPNEGIAPGKGFSPNGDNLNDFWLIGGIEAFPDNHVKVFNRWGHLVFEVSGYDNRLHRWHGEINGEKAALENTYFFIITATTLQSMTGYVIVKP